MPPSKEQRIGREATIFGVALGVSALQNYAVRYFIGTKQKVGGKGPKLTDEYKEKYIDACLARGGGVRYADCKRELIEDAAERREAGSTTLSALTKAAVANVGLGFPTVFIPLTGAYYAWDYVLYGEDEKMSAEILLAPAITFGIVAYFIHTVISTAARPRSHFEVWLYASVFALSVTGLSSLMHEFYPVNKD